MHSPVLRRRRPRPPFTPRRFRPGQLVCTKPSLDVDGALLCDHGYVIRCWLNHPLHLPGWSYLVKLHPATQSRWAAAKPEWFPECFLQALED
jgi:hypothetical protein